jgi:site-specific recombinase XerD
MLRLFFMTDNVDFSDMKQVTSDPQKPPVSAPPPHSIADLRAYVDDLARAARAPNTRRAYSSSFDGFRRWATAHGFAPLPASPETVALFIGHLAKQHRKVATVERALVAISQTHVEAGLPSPRSSPVVRQVLRGLRRIRAGERAPAYALTEADLRAMVDGLPTDIRGLRDRAILVLGFRSGLHRAELVALSSADITLGETDLVVRIAAGKTDPEGRGRTVRVARCPNGLCGVASVDEWLRSAAVTGGPLFRRILKGARVTARRLDGRTIDRVVKAAAALAGISRHVSAHSLRSGFATDAALRGVDERTIMRTLGHRDAAMTRRYIRDGG